MNEKIFASCLSKMKIICGQLFVRGTIYHELVSGTMWEAVKASFKPPSISVMGV